MGKKSSYNNNNKASAEKGDAKKEEAPKTGNTTSNKKHNVSILKYDTKAYANFSKFEKELEEVAGYEFGDLFSIAKTGVYPISIVPTPRTIKSLIQEEKDAVPSNLSVAERKRAIKAIEDRWANMEEEDLETISEGLKDEWKSMLKVQATNIEKRKQDKVKLYWMLRSLLSSESLDAVKQHLLDRLVTLEASQDPLQLWTAIKATHTTYSSGIKEVDEAKARKAYASLRQYKGETLTSFKDRMVVYVRSMESLGLTVPSAGQLAADFLDKLNDTYESRRNTVVDNCRLGGSFPKSLFEAYKIVSN